MAYIIFDSQLSQLKALRTYLEAMHEEYPGHDEAIRLLDRLIHAVEGQPLEATNEARSHDTGKSGIIVGS